MQVIDGFIPVDAYHRHMARMGELMLALAVVIAILGWSAFAVAYSAPVDSPKAHGLMLILAVLGAMGTILMVISLSGIRHHRVRARRAESQFFLSNIHN